MRTERAITSTMYLLSSSWQVTRVNKRVTRESFRDSSENLFQVLHMYAYVH
jgi:hypothetical protein